MERKTAEKIISALSENHERTERMEKCALQTSLAWTEKDGSEEELIEFCKKHFASDPKDISALLKKAEINFDAIDGYMIELLRTVSEPLHLDTGDITPADQVFTDFNPLAHITEDYYHSKIAFLILINFPIYSLEEKNSLGKSWSNEEWAAARLADKFSERIPPEVLRKAAVPQSRAGMYISDYNICMDKLVDGDRRNLFPEGMKLISHWGLRDEIKALYKEQGATRKQEIIEKVLSRVVNGEVPSCVINCPDYEWDPFSNKTYKDGKEIEAELEGAVRYAHLKKIFESEKTIDPYVPSHPTAISRNFECSVEIEEAKIRSMLEQVLESPVIKELAEYASKKIGRPLRAFDIWFPGFRDSSSLNDTELNKIIAERYGDRDGFQKSIPDILKAFGFTEEKAAYLASKITVDPARGAGHAMGAGGRAFNSHLRTRFPGGKMNYNSYNVAIHELGHCVEQVFSLNLCPSPLMSGVPNTAFTEGFAFVFQGRDQDVLGLSEDKSKSEAMIKLHGFWHCFELSGVSLVCMDAWRFMYANPEASPEEIRDFVLSTAKAHWNRWFAPVFGEKDSILLAVYSHMIEYGLYLPNYPLGEIIRSQVETHLEGRSLAEEMEKLCVQGCLTPDLWLSRGTGNAISADYLIKSAEKAIRTINK